MSTSDDLVRRWVDVFNSGDLADVDELAAAEFDEHALAPFGREAPGRVHGPTHLRQTVGWLTAQFPDLVMAIEAIVMDRDLVVARISSSGTNLGPLNGSMPPTGRRFSSQQSHWFRVADGKLAEHWATRDDLTAMVQLGVVAPPGPPRP